LPYKIKVLVELFRACQFLLSLKFKLQPGRPGR
jgi:hypothetical protein